MKMGKTKDFFIRWMEAIGRRSNYVIRSSSSCPILAFSFCSIRLSEELLLFAHCLSPSENFYDYFL